ncbi:MAG: hypothetical protein FWG04_05160 [Desulfovibrionaceae bacterium]|nr:hypothetical protein [Desulfovibrionaceae bacterium]
MGERMKALDRDGFLKRAVIREVSLPDGSTVCIRALPASMLVAGADSAASVFEPANLLVRSLCDENGALLFRDDEKSEIMAVDHMALKAILDAILELNGLGRHETEAGSAEKN